MSTLTEYKCPNCGGSLEFNSTTQTMKCPFCDSEFSVESIESDKQTTHDIDSQDNISWNDLNSDWGQEQNGMKVYYCNSCGGEIICDETTTATKCPYCDNQVTMKGAFTGDYRPDLIIPFKLDKKAAKANYKKFISHRPFLPKDFKDANHIDEIKGVYVPEWLFDCTADANAVFDATHVRHWSDKDYDYTETSHYNVYRAGNLSFAGIPVDGSSKMDDDLMESIEPFNLSEAVDFKAAYLAGYLSDKYDVGIEESTPRANERIRNSASQVLKSTVSGYTSVTEKKVGVNTKNGLVKYALYPVWLLNTTYNGKKNTFAMNGQTGKIVGNLPINKGKLYGVAVGIGIGVTAALSALSYFLFF